jgi:hypothetical protein
MLLDPALYRGQRSLCRRLTAYVDIAVIRIPAVSMPPSVQFPIQCIQVDIRQQRRQDSPNAKDNFAFDRRLEFRRKSGAD